MEALSARHCSTRSKEEGLSAFRFSRQLQVKSVRLRHLVLYYKDMRGRLRRSKRGRLKLGYGPGGPLVLATGDPLNLLNKLVRLGCLSEKQITNALRSKVIFSSVDEGRKRVYGIFTFPACQLRTVNRMPAKRPKSRPATTNPTRKPSVSCARVKPRASTIDGWKTGKP